MLKQRRDLITALATLLCTTALLTVSADIYQIITAGTVYDKEAEKQRPIR
tara:strand:- start:571 stop:720 length:150 start_codon:yes stop_codon:yes gene_type:complete